MTRLVHDRHLDADPDAVGRLLDGLGSPEDRLWPADRWPAMVLERPLRVGARGGHGPVRYRVETYLPGRLLRLRLEAPRGFSGWHEFAVEAGPDGALLRHTLVVRPRGLARLTWPLVLRPLHQALVADCLDTAASALCGGAAERRRPPAYVRLLRALGKPRPGGWLGWLREQRRPGRRDPAAPRRS